MIYLENSDNKTKRKIDFSVDEELVSPIKKSNITSLTQTPENRKSIKKYLPQELFSPIK